MPTCPYCASNLPNGQIKFCPRCGRSVPAQDFTGAFQSPDAEPPRYESPPIRLERRGSLRNKFFITSVVMVVVGGVLAGEGEGLTLIGIFLLVIGLPCVMIATVRSLVR